MSSSQLYYIHLNLSISLLLALALLLIGLTTATDIRVGYDRPHYHKYLQCTIGIVWSDSWVTALSVPLCVLLDAV